MTLCLLILVLFLFITYRSFSKCDISDKEAINSATAFTKTFQIKYEKAPVIYESPDLKEIRKEGFTVQNFLRKHAIIFYKGLNARTGNFIPLRKEVSFEDVQVQVSCQTGEVLDYFKAGSPQIKSSNLISKKEAEQIIESISEKINMPKDMRFERLTQENGKWFGFWTRQKNGYRYLENISLIGISDITGEFESFSKSYWGTDCPTDVNISKDEALKISKDKLQSYYSKNEWTQIRDKFEVTNIELLIVQPNAFLGLNTPFKSKTSRLAWLIRYKQRWDSPSEHRSYENTEIWIDAANGKYLGGY